MTDLEKLIAAVEAGRWWGDSGVCAEAVHRAGFKRPDAKVMTSAFNGSLDAAKALHEALLPGWSWQVENEGWATVYKGDAMRDQTLIDADAETSARAWLLAILRAYAARDAA